MMESAVLGWVSQGLQHEVIAMASCCKKGGDSPSRETITAKPLETRQGSGKSALAGWVAPVKPGRVLYEVDGVTFEEAREALTRAAHKLPVKTMIVVREEV